MTKWRLLAKYIFDQPQKEEKQKVEHWIKQNPEEEHIINELIRTKGMKNQADKIDVDQAWNNVKGRILESKEEPRTRIAFHRHRSLLQYAAILLVLIGLGSAALFSYQSLSNSNELITKQTKVFQQDEKITFSDGSVAFLNGNSHINYPKTFAHKNRLINIKGEAFFDVTHNPQKPFVIKAEKAKIEVLGTSFNVKTNNEGAVEVYVKTGKVRLSQLKSSSQSILIKPGYIGIINDNQIYTEKNEDLNYISWKTKKLYFKNTKLSQVTTTLERTYNVKIGLDEKHRTESLALTATFDKEPIDHILDVISETFNMQVVKSGKRTYRLIK